jgi:hypothetical protein
LYCFNCIYWLIICCSRMFNAELQHGFDRSSLVIFLIVVPLFPTIPFIRIVFLRFVLCNVGLDRILFNVVRAIVISAVWISSTAWPQKPKRSWSERTYYNNNNVSFQLQVAKCQKLIQTKLAGLNKLGYKITHCYIIIF